MVSQMEDTKFSNCSKTHCGWARLNTRFESVRYKTSLFSLLQLSLHLFYYAYLLINIVTSAQRRLIRRIQIGNRLTLTLALDDDNQIGNRLFQADHDIKYLMSALGLASIIVIPTIAIRLVQAVSLWPSHASSTVGSNLETVAHQATNTNIAQQMTCWTISRRIEQLCLRTGMCIETAWVGVGSLPSVIRQREAWSANPVATLLCKVRI